MSEQSHVTKIKERMQSKNGSHLSEPPGKHSTHRDKQHELPEVIKKKWAKNTKTFNVTAESLQKSSHLKNRHDNNFAALD